MTAILDNEITTKPATWLEAHGDFLYRYAIFRLRNVTVAEDAVRKTLLAAQVATQTSHGKGSERSLLLEILKHQIIDHCRRIAGTRDEFTADVREAADAFFQTSGEWPGHWREEMAPIDWQFDITSKRNRTEFWEKLDRCLSKLPRAMALAFTLREIDGLSSEEICDALNVSRSNLWLLLHLARLRLRNSVETDWIHAEPPKVEPNSEKMARQIRTSGIAGIGRALRSAQVEFQSSVRFPKVLRLMGWSE